MNDITSMDDFPDPEYLFTNREFKSIAIKPPDFDPGSWCGAGKIIYDEKREEYLLTNRPRSAKNDVRGFAAEIYGSKDGINNFNIITSLSKEEVQKVSGIDTYSIEGTQLLRDPTTQKWHFYLSIDTGKDFVWGGLVWQTLLLIADNLMGPWESKGLVLKNELDFERNQARDSSIDIIEGKYYCIYKGKDLKGTRRPGFATSDDGINWNKHGALTVDGEEHKAFLSGSIFPSSNGLIFIGMEMLDKPDPKVAELHETYDKFAVKHGGSMTQYCVYRIDIDSNNLETLFTAEWDPSSEYEFKAHPLLGYSSSLYEPDKNRFLFYVEAIDGRYTKKTGLNNCVEIVEVYETKI
jgi:hypothetical protein